jgi:superfamily II DNA or RNA helicase
MPTGAGKTILAMMIMANIKRSTLIVVPTIDLLQQWERVIQGCYGGPVGVLGGGQHDIQPVTVTTYDSAAIHIERLGDRFGLVIFDECHHLPAPQYQFIAQSALAPFRLGLSATVQRPDGKEAIVYNLVGPLVYEGKIREMSSNTLAPYEVITMPITMNPDEQEAYDAARKTYTSFIKSQGIRMDQRDGWIEFIKRSARSSDGRKAMKAYWVQKRLSQAAAAKVSKTWEILQRHRGQRILIFTDDNLMAYRIGREFLVPVLTHKTKLVERKRILACFRQGTQTVIATSKVLNEGVDVPEASIGVVLSGSGAVREHVQRLGRILRHQEGKTAILYELIAKGTGEHYVNQRRKQHDAYEGPAASATTRW